MVVIKHGTAYAESDSSSCTCSNCNCEFEYIICPECFSDINLPHVSIEDIELWQ